MRRSHKILIRTHKNPLRRPKYRGQNNTNKDIIHTGREDVEVIMEVIREVL
jgi:hypothetical protein